MEQLKYVVEDSTIAEILGVQNFSTKESAVLELVKNAYDAHANNLRIAISSEGITIVDDGLGMNRDMILTHWMHVGKSPKGYTENGRIMAGSKGVGRFALARLGRRAIVSSRRSGDDSIIWTTDWNTSGLEICSEELPYGTQIHILDPRDKWTRKGVLQLVDYLSRTCAESDMIIEIVFNDEVYTVAHCLKDLELGRDYVWRIELEYKCSERCLRYRFIGDEFQDEAQDLCEQSIYESFGIISVADEFAGKVHIGDSDDIHGDLEVLGDFSACLYFQNKHLLGDAEKFLYKTQSGLARKINGIILYRNSFSISGYEGKRDWLELGKRSRKSPAAASHPTGSWRVRENQMLGRVDIDKRKNAVLTDLSNRQGLEENQYYDLFVEVITIGISKFERYRQELVRSINKKNKEEKPKKRTILDRVIKDPKVLPKLSGTEQVELVDEIKEERKQAEQQKSVWDETEQRYRYDIRLLNILATLGLRSSSMAHEMHNQRSAIVTNCDNIIRALKHYGYWEELESPEKTRVQYRNVPALLQVAKKVEAKMVSFMDVMLTEVEKQKFTPKQNDIYRIVNEIKDKWEGDYSKLVIDINADINLQFFIAEDIIVAILDNLILNSVQQNEKRNKIHIDIHFDIVDDQLVFTYSDDGNGLIPKYLEDPMRILEVHETSRENGHGLGMWIVNNSVQYTEGKITSINGLNGFKIEFCLGGERN